MRRLRSRAPVGAALLLAAAAVAGSAGAICTCGSARPRPATAHGTHWAVPAKQRGAQRIAPAAPRAQSHAASALVDGLSTAQLAGQRIVYSYAGLTPPQSLLALIRAGEAAGVILYADNISSIAQVEATIGELQAADAAGPVHAPLLVLTDQEGGLVRRLPGAPALSERQIGQHPDAIALAAEAGRGAGMNLARAGINVNLAPVLDVYRRPGDFIDQFQRSYGMDASRVASLGTAFITAQQRIGVAATAKHFPGLGAAESGQDTDLQPVTLDLPLRELRDVDELPFRAAIAAGVRLVMLSWAAYPALDGQLPAGLSPTIIQGELRGRLGFRGVTISDGIGARALQRFGTPARRGVLAARAGVDLLLCSAPNPSEDSPALGVSVLHGLARALTTGAVGFAGARQATERVIALRTR